MNQHKAGDQSTMKSHSPEENQGLPNRNNYTSRSTDMVAQLQYTPRICWRHMLNAYVAHKTSGISLSWGFVGWVGCAPWCTHFGSASGRCIRSTRRAGRSHGPGRTGRRRGTGSGSCALPAARQGQFGAGRYGACPAAGQPFRGGQNRPTAGAETQFLEPDIGAGSTERTFRVCVSASEKFDRLLRVYSVE